MEVKRNGKAGLSKCVYTCKKIVNMSYIKLTKDDCNDCIANIHQK